MVKKVAVVGGGYAGASIAHAMDQATDGREDGGVDVVLIDPRDGFVNVAACLRALVRPEFAPSAFFPFERVLPRGQHVRDLVVSADADGVTLAGGGRVDADYIVLATGSTYSYPARPRPTSSSAAQALTDLQETHQQLAAADRVLILGAGPVGLELAGEIHEVWPEKKIVVLDPSHELLPGFLPELADDLRSQIAKRGIDLQLGTSLTAPPPTPDGQTGPFTVTTTSGEEIPADIWFRTFGLQQVTHYLKDGRLTTLTARGHIPVDDHLRVIGPNGPYDHIYAAGDIADLPDAKMATHAQTQAPTVVENISSQLDGRSPDSVYLPALAPRILLPLGTSGGVGQMPTPEGPIAKASLEAVVERKGLDLFTARFTSKYPAR